MSATATISRPADIAERAVEIVRQSLRDAIADTTTELTAFEPASRDAAVLRARRDAFAEVLSVVLDDELTAYATATA